MPQLEECGFCSSLQRASILTHCLSQLLWCLSTYIVLVLFVQILSYVESVLLHLIINTFYTASVDRVVCIYPDWEPDCVFFCHRLHFTTHITDQLFPLSAVSSPFHATWLMLVGRWTIATCPIERNSLWPLSISSPLLFTSSFYLLPHPHVM